MDEELRKQVEQYIREQERLLIMNNTTIRGGTVHPATLTTSNPYGHQKEAQVVYSLAEVQLVSGDMIGITITASPTVSKYLLDTMKSTGFLHLYNTEESLMIRASDVRAIKLTKITKE
jgi:hypothetical protein